MISLTYEEALKNIKSLEKIGSKPGLERISKLLGFIGNPHSKLKCIHVAGTNGKGSVCFMLASILKESGYRTGLYISPSIEDFRERIQIDGNMISKKDFCECFNSIAEYLKKPCFLSDSVTEFELTTAIAFKYFQEKNCDIVVLETGMGGRLDATNVINRSLCSVITSISKDHMEFLGDTELKIAKEKFGIIKRNSKVVIGSKHAKEIYRLLKNRCKELSSKFYIASPEDLKDFCSANLKESIFKYLGTQMKVPLLGDHQRLNIALVISVLEILKDELRVSLHKIKLGLEKVKLPCRIEIVSTSPLVIMDASHNPESVMALYNFLTDNFKDKELIAVFCMLKGKDIEGTFKIIGGLFKKVIVVKSNSFRALDIGSMVKIIKKYNKNVYFSEEFESIKENFSEKEGLVIFGSFTILHDAKKVFGR